MNLKKLTTASLLTTIGVVSSVLGVIIGYFIFKIIVKSGFVDGYKEKE